MSDKVWIVCGFWETVEGLRRTTNNEVMPVCCVETENEAVSVFIQEMRTMGKPVVVTSIKAKHMPHLMPRPQPKEI